MMCRVCKDDKDEADFHFKNRDTGKRQTICKACSSNYSKHHYIGNKISYILRGKVNAEKKRTELAGKVLEYLSNNVCIDCGESDPVVLDFDHKQPADKKKTISHMCHACYSWEAIVAEISKCDVRCSNCHRRRTSTQFNWRRQRGVVSNY